MTKLIYDQVIDFFTETAT